MFTSQITVVGGFGGMGCYPLMSTKEPVPPPEKPSITNYDVAEYILQCAVSWRRLELQKSALADGELNNLRSGIDMLNERLVNPPTSPPQPRKR